MIVSGGLRTPRPARRAYEESGAAAVMIARGSLGNPWLFEELTGGRAAPPAREEIVAELLWVDRPRRGAPRGRAGRALPAQVLPLVHRRLQAPPAVADELQRSADLDRARDGQLSAGVG